MKKAAKFITLISVLNFSLVSWADSNPIQTNRIYHQGQIEVSLEQALSDLQAGDILVLGEQHGTEEQAGQQMQILNAVRKQGFKVSVGMEFFERQTQSLVDALRFGSLSEIDFLKAIGWGKGFPFSSYRSQVHFPHFNEGVTIALNAPRSLTSRIAKVGVLGLSEEEKSQLPEDFQVGNANYFRRFQEIMGSGHVPPEALMRYFEAQSTWDDVMAFEATRFIEKNLDQILVIIVGDFHVQYGGGLPDRLQARLTSKNLPTRLKTFSLVNLEGMSEEQKQIAVLPTQDGQRADYVWTSEIKEPK